MRNVTSPGRRYDAVFLDALGTLVELEPPWERLAAELGIAADERLVAAFGVEMRYYREHAHEGRDDASLAELHRRCAEVLSAELGREVPVGSMMAAIRFRPFPDAAPALTELREAGVSLLCVSNWDCSLPQVLHAVGLAPLLDGVVTSAQAGARKPSPAIFARALALAKCAPERALHVGDTPEEDREGAAAAGVQAVLIDRDTGADVSSLAEIPPLLRA